MNKAAIVSGADSTTVIRGAGVWPFYISHTSGTAELKKMSITGGTGDRAVYLYTNTSPTPYARISEVVFYNIDSSRAIEWYNYVGLVDNSTFRLEEQGVRIWHNRWEGGNNLGHQSWYDGPEFGTDQAVFFENNTFIWDTTASSLATIDCEDGGRLVFRYNDVTGMRLVSHGAEDTGGRSCLFMEIYENTWDNTGGSNDVAFQYNGGTGYAYNNIIDGYSNGMGLLYRRATETFSNWDGACDGDGNYDENAEASGYACLDMPGRAGDATLMANSPMSPAQWPSQEQVPIYEYNNETTAGTDVDFFERAQSSSLIVENQDYYNDTQKPGYAAYNYPHPLNDITERLNVVPGSGIMVIQ
jgi:hypothetical protein